ncbi:MAG: tail fiber protein [Burkholderiaceae bacterium]|nr:tail fiber protein [Burkholderiaceae bacterium]
MANLPANSEMTGSGVTEGGFKAKLNDVLDYLRDCFGSVGTVTSVRAALGLQAMATKANVATGDLVDGAVTTAKLADAAVSAAKLAANAALPAGAMCAFGGSALPAGWLWCNGAAVSRTTYAALFAAIGTAFGAGDGASTFNLPDLRDRVPIGQGTMGGVSAAGRITNTGAGNPGLDTGAIGNAGGVDRHTLSIAQMPAHTHDFASGLLRSSAGSDTQGGTGFGGSLTATQSRGGGEAHPNVQPSLVCTWIIKT